MALWDSGQIAAVLGLLGMAGAAGEPLDVAAMAAERDEDARVVGGLVDRARAAGLVVLSDEEPDQPPILTRAGSQYLAAKGDVAAEVLHFLPGFVDDLNARRALIDSGNVLVDEFRGAVLDGRVVDHAATLVPPAFAEAIDESTALDLFAAAVALMARLSYGHAAGCTGEEIVAVALVEEATAWFEMERDFGAIAAEDVGPGVDSLRGVFDLFEDDDVLDLFEMQEPADAAIAGHSPVNLQAGVVDQRLEAWFRPFGAVVATGYLHERGTAEG